MKHPPPPVVGRRGDTLSQLASSPCLTKEKVSVTTTNLKKNNNYIIALFTCRVQPCEVPRDATSPCHLLTDFRTVRPHTLHYLRRKHAVRTTLVAHFGGAP